MRQAVSLSFKYGSTVRLTICFPCLRTVRHLKFPPAFLKLATTLPLVCSLSWICTNCGNLCKTYDCKATILEASLNPTARRSCGPFTTTCHKVHDPGTPLGSSKVSNYVNKQGFFLRRRFLVHFCKHPTPQFLRVELL